MNIVEAYIKFNQQLLILISGLPECGKLSLGKKISRDFKIKLINQFQYYKKDYDKTIKLQDGTAIIDWYTDDSLDWNRFNEDINKYKKNGLVVVGFSMPDDKIKSQVDFHIHLTISKHACIEKRKLFLKENEESHKEEFDLIGSQTEKLIMNQLIYPYYLESIKKSTINKFINLNNKDDEQAYDETFDYLINQIEGYLYKGQKKNNLITPKVTEVTKSSDKKTSESISASMELLETPVYSYDDNPNMIEKYSSEEYDDDSGPIQLI